MNMASELRDGNWVNPGRIRAYAFLLLIVSLLMIGYLLVTAHGINDSMGRPIGTDYANIYAAGKLALEGHPAAPFSPELHHAKEQEIFGADTPFFGWHYPPFFLMIAAALASLPYLTSLAVWQFSTLLLYLKTQSRILPGKLPFLAALAFPAVQVNITHGHNGFLTAALLTGGLLLLRRRPGWAGICFGLMAYKPQFGIIIPLALIAARYWKAFFSASFTVILLAAITTLLFGVGVWPAFIESTHFTRTVVLEQGGTGFHKIQSVFAWVRLWGGGVDLAYILQGITLLWVIVSQWRIWRSLAPFEIKAASLVVGGLLATPYLLDYDLVIMAPAIALCVRYGLAHGFQPYEKTLLAVAFLAPFLTRQLALHAMIPFGTILLLVWYFTLLKPRTITR